MAPRGADAPRATPCWKVWTSVADGSVNVIGDGGAYICLVGREARDRRDDTDDTDQIRADARLIAAAPRMRQALREVVGDAYYLPNPGDTPRCGFCQQPRRGSARAGVHDALRTRGARVGGGPR